ncbi:MAG: TonB-dependent receptor plug domain-containing protein [Pseudomonadota bacterium]|nr:TonB-dependent receptor plug domain-containing protein [Pseudomonadota bacterium]
MRHSLAQLSALLLIVTVSMGEASTTKEGAIRQTYYPEDFSQFVPRSALDLVKQVPGVSIYEGGDDRGFGQADTNVLINGRRVSGKSNGPMEALERLSLNSVIRLEVVDGASLDIGGISGQVINVITASEKEVTGLFRYSPRTRPTGSNSEERLRDFTVALTGGSDDSEWTLRVANEQRRFGEAGDEVIRDSVGEITDTRFERALNEFDKPSLSGSYSYIAENGSAFNLVAELNGSYSDRGERSERRVGDPNENTRVLDSSEDEHNYEIGTDYEFSLGAGRLKFMGLHRFESSPTVDRTTTTFVNGLVEGTAFTRQADEAESIIRAELSFPALNSQWRWSLEATDNYLDLDSQLDRLDAQGVFIPVDLPDAEARVEETRTESTLNVSKRLNEQLTFQATVGAEYSKIKQTGSSNVTRDFVRPKGFLALNYRPTNDLFLSAKLERAVGQLRFFDFIASLDVNQERENVTNVNLVPPQSWDLTLEAQQSLGKSGNLTLSLFYEDVEDIVDRIPIKGGGQAPGNIDKASTYGGFFDATFLSDEFLWKGGRADISLGYINSKVKDPILGNTRKISDEFYKFYELRLRQDFNNTPWAIGAVVDYEEEAPSVRIDEVSFNNRSRGTLYFYVEHKDVMGLTVKAFAWNLLGAENRFRRTVYSDRLANEVLFSEHRSRNFGYSYTLVIEGAF